MDNKYTSVKKLVDADLSNYSIETVKTISKSNIDKYFSNLVQTKAHLAPSPLKLGTVNRYVELYLKSKQ